MALDVFQGFTMATLQTVEVTLSGQFLTNNSKNFPRHIAEIAITYPDGL
ncbi:MAG: hypothetical protein LBB54_07415 [Cellulomonadaceae bacterium]|nr:hypothetical protein [Cellulomonadaceae bacterium]